jgi:hypothetical protein
MSMIEIFLSDHNKSLSQSELTKLCGYLSSRYVFIRQVPKVSTDLLFLAGVLVFASIRQSGTWRGSNFSPSTFRRQPTNNAAAIALFPTLSRP